jgi:hypothetical protein
LDALIRWSQVEVAAFVLLGAAMASLAIVEVLRMVWPRTAQWSDARHFSIAALLWAVLFAIQYSGVWLMLQAHGG